MTNEKQAGCPGEPAFENTSAPRMPEEEIFDSRTCLPAFIAQAPVALAMFDTRMRYLSFSRQWAAQFGLGNKDLNGLCHYEVMPETPEGWKENHRRALEGEVVKTEEERFPKADGSVLWLHGEVRPWHDRQGRIGGIIVFSEEITRRKAAEETLQEKEKFFRLMAENINDIFWIASPRMKSLVYVNPSFERVWGRPRQLIYDSPGVFMDWIHPEDRELVREDLARGLSGTTPYTHAYRFLRPDGTVRWLEACIYPIFDDTGQVYLYTGTGRDITDQKALSLELEAYRKNLEKLVRQRTASLEASEAKLRAIVDAMPDVAFLLDAGGRYLEVLTSSRELLYVPEAELIGRRVADLLPEAQATLLVQTIEKTLATRDIQTVEYFLPLAKGKCWFEGRCVPILSSWSEQDAGLVFFVARDITYRKRIEELETIRLKFVEAAVNLAVSEEALSHFLGSTCLTLGWDLGEIWSYSAHNGTFRVLCIWQQIGTRANDFMEVTGRQKFTPGVGLPGILVQSREPIWVEDVTADPRFIRQSAARKAGLHTALAVPIILDQEVTGALILYCCRIMEREEDLVRTLSELCKQIGQLLEKNRAVEQLKASKIQSESASRAKSSFLANMSHEIRTPMNAILGFTQVLLRDAVFTPRQLQLLRIIEQSGTHLMNLINNILDLSKIESGKIVLDQREFSLRGLLESIDVLFRAQAQGKGLDLHTRIDPDLPPFVLGDEGKLRQILNNLLSNAIKFTAQGRVSLQVNSDLLLQLDPAEEGKVRLNFCVEDSGPGISQGDLERIFHPFEQSQAGFDYGGSGLGLTIAREFVQLMGGDLAVSSSLGQGSRFDFHVLVRKSDHSEKERISGGRQILRLRAGTEPLSVLVADDSADNRLYIRELLVGIGISVFEAENGMEALDAVEQLSFHAVLLDIRMPVMDGYEVIARIRASDRGKNLPIIAVTASAFREEEEKAVRTGANAYLRKPFRPVELYDILGQQLGLTYEYAAESRLADSAQSDNRPAVPIPEDLREKIAATVEEGDIVRLKELIALVGGYDRTAEINLQSLADQFDYHSILKWITKNRQVS